MNKEILITRIDELCELKGIKRNVAFRESHVGKNFVSNLKKSNPSEGKLTMLANYFGVSVKYLIGETNDKAPPEETPATIIPFFSSEEIALIYAYRSQPKLQQDVKRLLGFPEEKDYLAAETKRNHKHVKNKLDDPNAELSNKVHNARLDETDVL